jgi:hypothetical protein
MVSKKINLISFFVVAIFSLANRSDAMSLDERVQFGKSTRDIYYVMKGLEKNYPGGREAFEELRNAIGYIKERCSGLCCYGLSKEDCDKLVLELIDNKTPREIILEAAFSMLNESSARRAAMGFGPPNNGGTEIRTGDSDIDRLRQLGLHLLKNYMGTQK